MITPFPHADFTALMTRLAAAWSAQDTESALDCFTPDATYMEPPDAQFFHGHDQLRPYFGALKPGTYLTLHNLWFNAETQIGCAEFSFGREGKPTADHGLCVVTIREGRIAAWREYFKNGPADFTQFTATDGKDWTWHSGNYP
jgi:ketosteroid isomerase-like protein